MTAQIRRTYHGSLFQIGQAVDLALGVGDAFPVHSLTGNLELEQSSHLGLSLVVEVGHKVARRHGEAAKHDGRDGQRREHHGDEEFDTFARHG